MTAIATESSAPVKATEQRSGVPGQPEKMKLRTRAAIRLGVVALGTVTFLLALPDAMLPPSPTFAVLLGLVVASEALAVRRSATNGVVSMTFVALAAAVFLLGPGAAALLGVLGVVLGDGLLRRGPALLVWEKASILVLMLIAGGSAVELTAVAGGGIQSMVSHAVMAFWAGSFLLLLLTECRSYRRWTLGCAEAAAALLFVGALWTQPLWSARLGETSMMYALTHVSSMFLLAGAFMMVDSVATSTIQIASAGLAGLRFWRYGLLPAFYQYNGQALAALLLLWADFSGGPYGLVAAAAFVVLGFYAYRLYIGKEDLLVASLCALSSALDAKDSYTQGHSDRVAVYSVALARALGFSLGKQRQVQLAAQLHDIGKIGIPDAVLLKPGRFTPEEYEVMKGHVSRGVEILWNVPDLRELARIVEQEHERWNGSGYPNGLRGEGILLAARIIAVADVYDALTSDRSYRKALSEEEARATLEDLAGVELDAKLVRAFLALQRHSDLEADLAFAYCLTH
ncbi:MAG: HD-GYP domain-containing protein [Chloroflexi bacterium]|nr:HD-GYP domain-containing protein [Chloroflexota bacterium]